MPTTTRVDAAATLATADASPDRTAFDDAFARHAGLVALAVALTATLGSYYFSEVAGYKPCKLCWYQRIAMYPLTLTLAIGLLRRDRNMAWYVLPPALVGFLIAGYHVLLQKTSWFSDACAAHGEVPCSSAYIYWLGFITIPVLSLTAFTLILLTASAWRPETDERAPWPRVLGVIAAVVAVMALLWWIGWDPASPLGSLMPGASRALANPSLITLH